MNKKNIFIISFLCALLCSCSKSAINKVVVTEFEQNGKLTAEVFKIPTSIFVPRFIGVTGNKLFIYKEKETELFEIFELPDCQYIGRSGDRGQGPNDFGLLDARSFQIVENGFKVLEAGSNILKTVTINDQQLVVTKAEAMFEKNSVTNGLYPLADSIYLTLGMLGQSNEYCLIDKKSATTKTSGTYPQWNSDEIPKNLPLLVPFIKSCVVHPNGKKFAAFYGRFKRIRICDNNASLLHDVEVKIEPFVTKLDTDVINYPSYYMGQPQAIKEYILVLCANSIGESQTNINKCELQIWDWNGKPIACYQLDRRISLIAWSDKYNKLYAFDRFTENEIYSYDIPLFKTN